MSGVPEGAQLSEDGYYWWDGAAWQPVNQHGADGGAGDGDAGQQTAEFAIESGLFVSPDDLDNPDNHVVLHHDAGTKVSFTLRNYGHGAGSATVTVYVDDQQVQTWTSGSIEAGAAGGPDDGYVHGCGRYATGQHVFRIVVTPGVSGHDSTTNTVDIE